MRRLATPAHGAVDSYSLCTSGVTKDELRRRLADATPLVATAAIAYDSAAAAKSLHKLRRSATFASAVTEKEMRSLYRNRMAKRSAVGRPIYDSIMAGAVNERCPLCACRTVSTLDHHLPQGAFPELALAPNNLVPACADCNKAKLDLVPTVAEEQTLHPYFDDVSGGTWLTAVLVEVHPASLRFHVDVPAEWDNTLGARVKQHFHVFKLGRAYASFAADQLANIRLALQELHRRQGASEVRRHLTNDAQSYAAANANSWQTATYRALARSDWYCDGGFSLGSHTP